MASTSSGSSSHQLRKDLYVSFVGYISNQIVGAKLPSNRQVLSVFFYNVRVVNLTTKESAALVIQEVSIFWQKARIPTRRTDHCVDKLFKLYDEWKGLQKNLTRTAGKEKEKRYLFVEMMDDLFDIAHSDALGQIKNEEDKNFLLLQRQKRRPGSMADVDQKLKHKEEKALEVMLEVDKGEEDEDEKNQLKRYILHQNDFSSFTNIEFSSFVTPGTKNFFTRFSISTDFLDKDPSTWKDDPGYKSGIEKLEKTVVVNDVAERGVKLIQDYNNILTKDETEKQFALQIVAGDRKKYPTATKSSLRKK